jgi:hypothetical protein
MAPVILVRTTLAKRLINEEVYPAEGMLLGLQKRYNGGGWKNVSKAGNIDDLRYAVMLVEKNPTSYRLIVW